VELIQRNGAGTHYTIKNLRHVQQCWGAYQHRGARCQVAEYWPRGERRKKKSCRKSGRRAVFGRGDATQYDRAHAGSTRFQTSVPREGLELNHALHVRSRHERLRRATPMWISRWRVRSGGQTALPAMRRGSFPNRPRLTRRSGYLSHDQVNLSVCKEGVPQLSPMSFLISKTMTNKEVAMHCQSATEMPAQAVTGSVSA